MKCTVMPKYGTETKGRWALDNNMHTEQTIKTLRSVFQFLNGVPEANELIQESCPGITNNEEEEEEVYSLRRKIRTEKKRQGE